MLNDCEISPTNYMIAFLRQRGWLLPESTMRIPNVIPEVDPVAAQVCARVPAPCDLLRAPLFEVCLHIVGLTSRHLGPAWSVTDPMPRMMWTWPGHACRRKGHPVVRQPGVHLQMSAQGGDL